MEKNLGTDSEGFIRFQESLIAEKRKMIEMLAEDIAIMQKIREKTSDLVRKFEINTEIAKTQAYIKDLGDWMEFDRTLIDEIKRGDYRGSDNLIVRDAGRAEGEARAGLGADEQHSDTGQGDRGFSAGGVDNDLGNYEARENADGTESYS